MKKSYLIILVLTIFSACKKAEFSPDGPTDVRVRNQSGYDFYELKIKIEEEEIVFGSIINNNVSEYHRFKTAYSKAYMSAKIDNVLLTTDPVDFTYMNYFGMVRLTYEVIIENNKLKINNVILDSELELK
jgi:hypothetical protein